MVAARLPEGFRRDWLQTGFADEFPHCFRVCVLGGQCLEVVRQLSALLLCTSQASLQVAAPGQITRSLPGKASSVPPCLLPKTLGSPVPARIADRRPSYAENGSTPETLVAHARLVAPLWGCRSAFGSPEPVTLFLAAR